jgi:hypothetical protein
MLDCVLRNNKSRDTYEAIGSVAGRVFVIPAIQSRLRGKTLSDREGDR